MLGPTRDLGPAVVAWGGTALSHIYEEVRLTLTGMSAEVFEALYGGTPVDTVHLGYSACEVSVPLTRETLANLATVMPGGTNSGGASGFVGVKPHLSVGLSMYDNGLPLFIKPVVAGVACDNGHWLRLERTYPEVNFDIAFNLRDQRVYALRFKAHPDATNNLLWSAGKVAEGTSY
ncbi:MAG: hypothetical protein PHQ43_00895 [Dehalococcoidales bacterium]|nr:hypothetical protein [Dehalococcoidales bacterium]